MGRQEEHRQFGQDAQSGRQGRVGPTSGHGVPDVDADTDGGEAIGNQHEGQLVGRVTAGCHA
jgi:hypothetical protein